MKWNYKDSLDKDFSPDSTVWIYQASRPFTASEKPEIENLLQEFLSQWKSHGTPVKGAAYFFFDQFIVLMADMGVSGCSTDSSIRLIKNIEENFDINMFDRTTLAFVVNDELHLIPLTQIQLAYDTGLINQDTIYFNNLVQVKGEFENKWLQPIKDSWLSMKISFKDTVS